MADFKISGMDNKTQRRFNGYTDTVGGTVTDTNKLKFKVAQPKLFSWGNFMQ